MVLPTFGVQAGVMARGILVSVMTAGRPGFRV